mgnify:CR=1 FL=1
MVFLKSDETKLFFHTFLTYLSSPSLKIFVAAPSPWCFQVHIFKRICRFSMIQPDFVIYDEFIDLAAFSAAVTNDINDNFWFLKLYVEYFHWGQFCIFKYGSLIWRGCGFLDFPIQQTWIHILIWTMDKPSMKNLNSWFGLPITPVPMDFSHQMEKEFLSYDSFSLHTRVRLLNKVIG